MLYSINYFFVSQVTVILNFYGHFWLSAHELIPWIKIETSMTLVIENKLLYTAALLILRRMPVAVSFVI